jgi:site-specific recombinase XerD
MPTKQLPLFPTDGNPILTRHSPVSAAIGPFQEHLRQEGRSPHTISAFTSDLRLLCEFFGDDMVLNDFTTTKLNRFMEWIEQGRGIPCSRKSYARRVTTLKVFFKFLKNGQILPDDPAGALLQRSGAAPLQPILSDQDINHLLAHTASLRLGDKPDARPDLLLRLLLDTGIKKSECMALTPEHVNRSDPKTPVLVVRHKKPTNVYKERKITLNPDWLTVLDEYLDQYRPEDTIFDCTARNLEYILRDVAVAAGVDNKVSFEILRWTSAVRDYQRGMDMEELREKMGLSRISWRETSDKIIRLAAQQNLPTTPDTTSP